MPEHIIQKWVRREIGSAITSRVYTQINMLEYEKILKYIIKLNKFTCNFFRQKKIVVKPQP